MKHLKTTGYLFFMALTLLAAGCGNSNTPGETTATGDKKDSGKQQMVMPAQANNYADSVNAGLIANDTLKGSPERTTMANMGSTHIHIVYHSPGVRGREIWGKLVAYNKVWVTGAHSATSIDFSKDVKVEGKNIKAGKYAFFTIPGKDKWTVILNTRYEQHQADKYNRQEDVARFEITPAIHAKPVQRLTYSVENATDSSAVISMQWEKIKIDVKVAAM